MNFPICQTKVKDGERAFIDPRWKTRSFEEGEIVSMIEKMHAYEADKRPTIFEVVGQLRQSLAEAKRKKR